MLADEQLFQRVQQDNQREILDKLLHDLRNPVHSLRITIELFSRLARRTGPLDVLLDRAARYVAPAEAAMNALVTSTERLGIYTSRAAAPAIQPVGVSELLTEVTVLLRGPRKDVQIELGESDATAWLLADRPRLGHALLRHCLSNLGGTISLSARVAGDDIAMDVAASAAADPDVTRAEFSEADLRTLIENAGGAVTRTDGLSVSIRFRRSDPP